MSNSSDRGSPEAPEDPAATQPAQDRARAQLWAFASQSLDHAILCMDRGGVVTWASPGADQILAASPGDLIGLHSEFLFTPEDTALGLAEQELEIAISAGAAEDDRWTLRADGSRFWASGMLVALRDENGQVTGFLKILRDMTNFKMQLETLRNRSEMLGQTQAAQRRSIATLAHELRNPLGSLGMATDVLRQLAGDAAGLQSPLGILERNIGFVARLIDDLESASRVAVGKPILVNPPEKVLLHELLGEAQQAALGSTRSGARDIDLLLPPAPISLQGDRLRLHQVFVNLIGNAIKFTGPAGRVWVKATVEGRQAVVRVVDDGVGIAPDMLERIFEVFTQADGPQPVPGFGIGLALVKEIVEMHGGSVEARSEGPGKGSEFSVRLPLQQRAAGALSPGAPAKIKPDPRRGSS